MALLIISALCIAIYSNSLDVPFHFDDEKNITEVESIRITDLNIKTVFDAGFNGRLSSRPLANISFALNYYFTGFDVSYFHIINILIHLINGVLVYLLSLSIFKRCTIKQTSTDGISNNLILFFAALFSACFFVAHPLQTQSVTYIVQRMNSLAVLFYLLSINLYIIGRSIEKQSHSVIIFAGCFVSWLLSLASKEIAVFLPLIIFLYEWYFFQNTDREWIRKRTHSIVLIFFIMVTIVMIYTDFHPISRILLDYQGRDFSLLERLMTQPRVVVFYLSLLILPLPSRLNLLHEFPVSHSFLDPATTAVSLFLLIAILALAIVIIKKHRIISFCILWFFIHLLIESSVIALEMVYEHRMYLPMVGISIAMGYLFMKFLNANKTLATVIALVILTAFAQSTHVRNEDWRTSESLWTDVISKNPNSHRGYYNLATVFLDQGRLDEAKNNYYDALRLKPDYSRAHNNLGNVLKQSGEINLAIEHYNKALTSGESDILFLYYYNLGHAYTLNRDYEAAMQSYMKSIEMDNRFTPAHYNIAELYEQSGQFELARSHYVRAVELKPTLADSYDRIGIIYTKEKDLENAIVFFKKAILTNSQYSQAYINLAKVYLFIKDVDNACVLFRSFPGNISTTEPLLSRLHEVCDKG